MTHPTEPGQRCRVIGGRSPFNGEGASPNQNKVVVTQFLHAEKAGLEQENVWHCRAEDGVLKTYYGAGPEADFLECWLEVIPPQEAPPSADVTKKELTA
ncbi:hypothetical protein H4CHR_02931 [Variovorax sp. PBS-H4]|uniref:hypothetical protein n=1 Tax=Variovorax sp. PBS-H4 TaxID=434008 RepID=UPI0013163B5C|nr:hypothetical protein [Variovorax sp. PBS-H4]VTU32046.1 hypothetical protein H4CHR_02931 [Variovorax sp. PBS-H4]